MSQATPLRLVVLISGSGSNLQAIINACHQHSLNAEIVSVISNRANARGLQRAKKAGIHQEYIDHTAFASRERFDAALIERIDIHQPELVILAGFMRILTPQFVEHYSGRLLNIHPSLLPKFQGLHTHKRALEAGEQEHGVSVHFVTAELDGGPVIMQAVVPVLPGDNQDTLAARVLEQEHQIYPAVIQLIAEGRVSLDSEQNVLLDQAPLEQPLRWSGS